MQSRSGSTATLPFAGFYESYHDAEFDREIESALEYTGLPYSSPLYDALQSLAFDAADFGAARLDYAQAYATAFLDWLGLDGAFESMDSPKEYNFSTNRVFVTLTRSDIARLWRGVDKAKFAKACRARFTSRSGFISHYSPDWKTWGRLSDWDHNQLGTLLQVYAETEQGDTWSSVNELDLMESYLCNGGVHAALWQGEKSARFWRIANYLEARQSRPVKTMAQYRAARRAENRPFAGTPLGQWVMQ